MNPTSALRIAAIFGFAAVALGAFGAHGFRQLLEANHTAEIWQKAVLYHLVHTAVLLTLACAARERLATCPFLCFSVGIVIFSGSLYALAITNVRWLGAITPIGGASLLAGWTCLALRGIPK